MTRFDDLTGEWVAKARTAQLEWFAYQKCAMHLIKMLKTVAGIDHRNLRTETLEGKNAWGEPFKDYLGWVDNWMHLRLRFVIPVPDVLSRPGGAKHDETLGVILRFRRQENGWVIRFYEDDISRPFVAEDDASVREICETLYTQIITWLKQKPVFDDDSKRIGFHSPDLDRNASRPSGDQGEQP